MKFDKAVIRKIAAVALIAGLALFAAIGAAADDAPKKGFVLFGLSQLYDGTEQISGGVGELLAGNEQLVEGLDTLGGALDDDIAGNLETMKSGIDEQILPGLGDIIAGLSGKVVPGLGDMKAAVDGQMVPGLGEMSGAIHSQIAPGIEDVRDGVSGKMSPGMGKMAGAIEKQMVPGLRDIRGGLKNQVSPGLGLMLHKLTRTEKKDGAMGAVEGLTNIRYGLFMSDHPGFDPLDPDTYGVSEALGAALHGINMTEDPHGSSGLVEGLGKVKGGLELQISPGLGSAIGTIGETAASPGSPDQSTTIQNDIAFALQAAYSLPNSDLKNAVIGGLTASQDKLAVVRGGLTGAKTGIDGPMVSGLEDALAGLGQIDAGLSSAKTGIDGQMVPGLDKILGDVNDDMVPGL